MRLCAEACVQDVHRRGMVEERRGGGTVRSDGTREREHCIRLT